MNFVILRSDGIVSSRLDTTINRQSVDFYVPDSVELLTWAPTFFVRLGKSGKAIAPQFASRYAEALSFGVLLYPDSGEVCDYSTLVPMPLYSMHTLLGDGNRFCVKLDTEEVYSIAVEEIRDSVGEILAGCSANTAIRIGDYAAQELLPPSPMPRPESGKIHLETYYCGNLTADIQIKF